MYWVAGQVVAQETKKWAEWAKVGLASSAHSAHFSVSCAISYPATQYRAQLPHAHTWSNHNLIYTQQIPSPVTRHELWPPLLSSPSPVVRPLSFLPFSSFHFRSQFSVFPDDGNSHLIIHSCIANTTSSTLQGTSKRSWFWQYLVRAFGIESWRRYSGWNWWPSAQRVQWNI